MWAYILAGLLALGFLTASMIGVIVVDKQKTITIYSRLGRTTNAYEIISVNIAFLVIALMLYFRYYIFIPAILSFIIFVIITTLVKSGLSPEGVFIGMTYLEWNKVNNYKIVNDDISTFTLKVRANKRQYVFRFHKNDREAVENLFVKHEIKVTETI